MPAVRLACAALLLMLAAPAAAEPPDHAPAHGYRAKQQGVREAPERPGGFEVVFDSERGVRIAVGFPDVFFSAGSFYRREAGHWQVSARPDRGWTLVASGEVPSPIYKAHGQGAHPGPASSGPAKKGRGK